MMVLVDTSMGHAFDNFPPRVNRKMVVTVVFTVWLPIILDSLSIRLSLDEECGKCTASPFGEESKVKLEVL